MHTLHTQQGFSLVETLVAITILLIIVTGPMTIATNATQGTAFSSEQVIASFLAQEGAELAQKARDDLLLPRFDGDSTNAWDEFTTTAGSNDDYVTCFGSGTCGLSIATNDVGSVSVVNCTGNANLANCRLYYDDTSNVRARYTHDSSGNTDTIYNRFITLRESGATDIEVTSTVTWRTGNQQFEQSTEVVTYLYNVYGR